MAEAVLLGLARDILKSLKTEMAKPGGSFSSQKIPLLSGAMGELQRLEDAVKTIQAMLLDAEKLQWHNNQVKLWLKKLKDVLYEIQDLLDDVATEDLRHTVTSSSKVSKEVRAFFSKSNRLAHRVKVANEIQELRKKLDEIAKVNYINLEPNLSEATLASERSWKTIPFVYKQEIIGREEDKRNIISHLFDSSPDGSVSVVSIVGEGGLGKTALAQLVYNDDEVKDHFKLKIWVCVSDIFDEDLIIKEILKSARYEYQEDPEMRKLQDIENKSKDQLQRLLLEVLDGKKYLLVLDDLWNEDRERWWELRRLLTSGSRGSKILITTRYRSVVEAIGAKFVIHAVHGLSEGASWELFNKMASGDGEKLLDPKLEAIGRGMIQTCIGVPLAIRTMGSLLCNKGESEWLYFKEHELSQIDKGGHGIMEVLKLSYDHLPWWLKNCFAYCALFPKHYVFDKWTMIQLWMAQGFIESLDENKDLEEIGNNYVLDLLFRSFLEVEKVDHSTGEVTMFKMHDLMHDLALKVAGDESKMINLDEDDVNGGIRHASFASQSSSLQVVISLLEPTNLRTILSWEKGRTSMHNLSLNEYQAIFSKLRHCRVLGLGYADFSIPPSLGSSLKHIRFFDVSGNRFIESLPDSITDLLNLQTLKLSGCKNLTTLPRDLRKLVNLRHLFIDGCDSLSHMPRGLSNLSSLQTLSQYILQKMDHNVPGGVGRVDELSGLNRLAGSITLGKLEFLQPALNKNHLREKHRLHSLELKWSWEKEVEEQDDRSKSDELIVWENLRPHQNLAHLTIFGYMGESPPNWLSSMSNLVDLTLWACKVWKYLSPLSELPSLRKLDLVSLDALEFVQSNTELSFFPSLERLFLLHCGSLKGWFGRTQLVGVDQDHRLYDSKSRFPKLSFVEIWDCPHLNSMPLFPCIEKLNIDGVSPKLLEQQVMAASSYPSEATLGSTFKPLSTLKDLYFGGMEDLDHSTLKTLLPFLGNLESVSLHRCIELRSLSCGMQYLSSLQHLDIWACKKLNLSSHDDEHGTQWRSLTKLRRLRIGLLRELVALPEGIRHITTLQSLEVEFCEKLTSLPEWIDNFSSLQELEIIGCPGITSLPNGMHRLTSLEKLRIFECPTLAKRCQTNGEDWEKIAGVPSFSLDGVEMKQNRNPKLSEPTRIRNFGSSLVGLPFSLRSK